MIDVLFLTYNDWANTGWKFFKCAQSIGLRCLAFKAQAHPFLYPEQTTVLRDITNAKPHGKFPIWEIKSDTLKTLIENSQIVHFTSSTILNIEGIDLPNRGGVVVNHSGREYRIAHDELNPIYNQVSSATIIQTPDMMGLGAKNEHLIYFPVDTGFLQPDYTRYSGQDNLIFGHFPSQAELKGSRKILALAEKLYREKVSGFMWGSGRTFEACSTPAIWYSNIDNIRGVDVLLDNCQEEVYGCKFGEWGNTALEAAAMGKIVVTNSFYHDIYKREYGHCELMIANTIDEMEAIARDLLTWPAERILAKREATRMWAHSKHGVQATAARVWDKIYRELL